MMLYSYAPRFSPLKLHFDCPSVLGAGCSPSSSPHETLHVGQYRHSRLRTFPVDVAIISASSSFRLVASTRCVGVRIFVPLRTDFVKPRWPRKMSAVPERRPPRTVRPPSRELAKALALVRAWGAQGGKKRAQRL